MRFCRRVEEYVLRDGDGGGGDGGDGGDGDGGVVGVSVCRSSGPVRVTETVLDPSPGCVLFSTCTHMYCGGRGKSVSPPRVRG